MESPISVQPAPLQQVKVPHSKKSGSMDSNQAGGTGEGSPGPVAITPETLTRIRQVCQEKDINLAMVCADAQVSALEELTEDEAEKIAEFYEK